jgi:hypothetical protein
LQLRTVNYLLIGKEKVQWPIFFIKDLF